MSSGIYSARTDAPFRAVGVGMASRFMCLGYGQSKGILGSKGNGAKRRCAGCVAAKQGKGG